MSATKTPEQELKAAKHDAQRMLLGLHSLIQDNIFREGWKSIGYEIEYRDHVVARLFPGYEEWSQPLFPEDGDAVYYKQLKKRLIAAQKNFFNEHTENLEEANEVLDRTLCETEEGRGRDHKAEAAWKSVRDRLQNKYGWTYNRVDSREVNPVDRGQLLESLWELVTGAGGSFGREDIDALVAQTKDERWLNCYKTFVNDGQSPAEAFQSANFVT